VGNARFKGEDLVIKKLLSIPVSLALVLSFASSAAAYSYTGFHWRHDPPYNQVTYCFEAASWPANFTAVISAAVEQVDAEAGNLYLNPSSWPCKIEFKWDGLGSGYNLAHTTTTVDTFHGWILSSVTQFNSSRPSDFDTTGNLCTVVSTSSYWQGGSDCRASVASISRHEAMHAIGFNHFGGADACATGYYNSQMAAACPTNQEPVMYINADDGYLRGLNSDDLSGINAVYG
jgi:hypothetical protein